MNVVLSATANNPPNIVARKMDSNGKRMNMNIHRKNIRLSQFLDSNSMVSLLPCSRLLFCSCIGRSLFLDCRSSSKLMSMSVALLFAVFDDMTTLRVIYTAHGIILIYEHHAMGEIHDNDVDEKGEKETEDRRSTFITAQQAGSFRSLLHDSCTSRMRNE